MELELIARILQMIAILSVLSVVLFGLMSAMPGNPVDMLIVSNPRVKPEDIVRLKKLRGLDQPWYVQYVRWMWGYHEPIRPVGINPIAPLELTLNDEGRAQARMDIRPFVEIADLKASSDELLKIFESERPDLRARIADEILDDALNDIDRVEMVLEKISLMDDAYYRQLLMSLQQEQLKELVTVGLFGAKADGFIVSQSFDKSGPQRMWFSVRNPQGLESVGSIYVNVNGQAAEAPRITLTPFASQVIDNPKNFKVDIASHVKQPESATSALRYELIDSPGVIDSKGIYSHHFENPGQSAVKFRVTNAVGDVVNGAFSVEHGPIADRSRFTRGFIFVFLGDTAALGFSNTYKRPVWELLAGTDEGGHGRIWNTLQLMLPAILLSLLIALPLGILSAYRQYSWLDYITNFFAFVGISLPVFWFGIMVMYLFAERLQWLPAGGVQDPGIEDEGLAVEMSNRFQHAILPTLVLSIAYIGRWLRYMRASMLEVLPLDYIRTARAKGLGEFGVVFKHALRNALIPVVTILALSIPSLFGGAVLTETVFSWPGIGRLEYDAVMNSDYYVAIVVFLIASFLVMIGNLLADLLYVLVDPRIRHR